MAWAVCVMRRGELRSTTRSKHLAIAFLVKTIQISVLRTKFLEQRKRLAQRSQL